MIPQARTAAPAWLTERPIAHRGLHDAGAGVVENSGSAARAALAGGYAIECDVQLSADGDAVVFHDFSLDRLTGRSGPLDGHGSAVLQTVGFKVGGDRIMSLGGLFDIVGAKTPIICEVKSRFDGDVRLADRVVALAGAYAGPFAVKSFDPAVIAHLRSNVRLPLGIVAEADYSDASWRHLSEPQRRDLAQFLHVEQTRPDFLSYNVRDLPHAVPHLCRVALDMPVMAWTVRRPEQKTLADLWADQIVFEGFRP